MTTIDLSHGAACTVVIDADALRGRLRPDLARDMIPPGVTRVKVERRYTGHNQVHVRLAGHTDAAVRIPDGGGRASA